jgi:hypothetical protein
MDCHEPNTHFKLVGTFKESDGFGDWAEQLFKHEGSCVWDSDTYTVMETYREVWPTYCRRLYYYYDSNGNNLYLHLQPVSEGNITIGLYADDKCSEQSDRTLSDYLVAYYKKYYGDKSMGLQRAAYWYAIIDTWNEYMNTFKICQPCRAYNLNKSAEDEESENREGRLLENGGEGDEEQWGYNCYDKAGYTNCNQVSLLYGPRLRVIGLS